MGCIDDDGIGIGDIDTVLHNGCGEQHVIVIIREVEHNLLQFFRLHLSMSDGDTGIGDILMDHLGNMRQVTNTVVHKIDLTITRHLEVDSIRYYLCPESMNLRLYRIAVWRRRLDDTEVTGSDE